MRLMFRAYALHPDETIEIASDVVTATRLWAQGTVKVWIDLEHPSREEMEVLAAAFSLDAESVEDCLSGEQRPRIDDYDNYLFLMLYGAVASEASLTFNPRKICIFFNSRYLITVHQETVLSVRYVFRRLERNTDLLKRGIDHVFFHLIDGLVDNIVLCAETYEDQMDVLEEESLETPIRPDLVTDVSRLRGDLMGFRRLVVSLRELVLPLSRRDYPHISEDLAWDFRHVIDHLTYAWELAEGLREVAQSIRENYSDQLARRTNDLMRTLTIFSTFLLPLSLISGIYGMNILLWPGPGARFAFPLVLGAMGCVATAMFVYFRKRGWI